MMYSPLLKFKASPPDCGTWLPRTTHPTHPLSPIALYACIPLVCWHLGGGHRSLAQRSGRSKRPAKTNGFGVKSVSSATCTAVKTRPRAWPSGTYRDRNVDKSALLEQKVDQGLPRWDARAPGRLRDHGLRRQREVGVIESDIRYHGPGSRLDGDEEGLARRVAHPERPEGDASGPATVSNCRHQIANSRVPYAQKSACCSHVSVNGL